ncbi:MAG: helix-turn-helix domain-containing protein [Methanoregula sp.]|nr:helix-turn-helix domain-containing protein [Methanoregula sp.]
MTKHTCTLMHCDTLVRTHLPSMRAEMVTRLIQRQGLTQSDAARKMGVTRAAVSQYMSRKRGGGEVQITSELDAIIDRWAMAVVTGESDINLCDICQCAMKKF